MNQSNALSTAETPSDSEERADTEQTTQAEQASSNEDAQVENTYSRGDNEIEPTPASLLGATPTSPTPVKGPATFVEMKLSPELTKALDELGWSKPTPIQSFAFLPITEGRDVIAQSKTGTGKTGAFGIPIADRLVTPKGGVQALLLAPTRELARQSADQIEELGRGRDLRVASVYGGASIDTQVRAVERGAEIVSGTPGRVLDLLGRGVIDLHNLKLLVLDEADEMLSMGFAKELHAIMEYVPEERQTLLFSATIDSGVQRISKSYLKDPVFVCLSKDQVGAEQVDHFVYLVSGKARQRDLANILDSENPDSAIIFCNTKAETDAVAASLQREGFSAEKLHGDVPQKERERVLGAAKSGTLRFLVATDVAARGVDIPGLSHVVNYTFPESPETFVHRAGRTARAGRSGTGISLVSPHELGALYYLRLQYGITPVERSLPTMAEQQTRIETDRLLVLEHAFSQFPGEQDHAVARRILQHPRAERIVAGLALHFFGEKQGATLDDVLSSLRRAQGLRSESTSSSGEDSSIARSHSTRGQLDRNDNGEHRSRQRRRRRRPRSDS